MLKIGDKIPEITLSTQANNPITISEDNDKKIVLFIYPKDNTPGCTIEAKDFSDLKESFKEKNAQIFGLSKDSVKSHQNFCTKQALNIDLLSDPEGKLIEAIGAWQKKSMYGKEYMGIVRTTVLINQSGYIEAIWEKVNVKNHAQTVLDSL